MKFSFLVLMLTCLPLSAFSEEKKCLWEQRVKDRSYEIPSADEIRHAQKNGEYQKLYRELLIAKKGVRVARMQGRPGPIPQNSSLYAATKKVKSLEKQLAEIGNQLEAIKLSPTAQVNRAHYESLMADLRAAEGIVEPKKQVKKYLNDPMLFLKDTFLRRKESNYVLTEAEKNLSILQATILENSGYNATLLTLSTREYYSKNKLAGPTGQVIQLDPCEESELRYLRKNQYSESERSNKKNGSLQ